MLRKRFELGKTRRHDFAASNIHGHIPALERLLVRIRFDDARNRLLAAGDLIDHVPAAALCGLSRAPVVLYPPYASTTNLAEFEAVGTRYDFGA